MKKGDSKFCSLLFYLYICTIIIKQKIMGEDLKLELYWSAPGGELIKCECKDVSGTIDLDLLIDFKKFEIDNILKKSFIAMADNFWRKASKRHPLKVKGIQAVLKLGRI